MVSVLENVKMSDELPINLVALLIWGEVLSNQPISRNDENSYIIGTP